MRLANGLRREAKKALAGRDWIYHMAAGRWNALQDLMLRLGWLFPLGFGDPESDCLALLLLAEIAEDEGL